jgi:hypothetical protein
MSLANVPDHNLLSEEEVLRRIKRALIGNLPFSLVRIGDGENIVLSQYRLMNEHEFMNTYWAKHGREQRSKGVILPNTRLRDQMVKAIRRANIVGICKNNGDEMLAPAKYKRILTNRIFDHYHIRPKDLCYVFVNRRMVSYKQFWEILHDYRVLLISKWSVSFKELLDKNYAAYRPKIVGCIDFNEYKEIPSVLKKIGQYQFDLALVSTGVNAVVMAPMIAEIYGKVAIDFGKTMMFFLKGDNRIKPWRPNASQPFHTRSSKHAVFYSDAWKL